jgi:uncharacterized surface protein with fasciclin (FAS1) repeats
MRIGKTFVATLMMAAVVFSVMGCRATRGNVVTATTLNSNTRTFNRLLKAAELDKKYSKAGPYTFFAPSDQAFDNLPAGTVQNLEKAENRAKLISLLTFHIVNGQFYTRDFTSSTTLKTENGENIKVNNVHSQWYYGDGAIINPDTATMNGILHIINKVQTPPNFQLPQ